MIEPPDGSRPVAPEPSIQVRGLTRRFGDFVAVDDLTFDVLSGEIFGFLGPNGAGKTTTIKMLTGLLRPSEGHGMVAGFRVPDERSQIRSRIGYMSQRFSLYDDLTVGENIELFGGLYGVTGERLRHRQSWILEMARLRGEDGRLTADLPLGFKQRLALGCSMLHEPDVLFLDEPTSGVDPRARRRFWDLIHELAASGTTILVSTHYMEEAESCDRLALLNRGRLIAIDTPRDLRLGMPEPIYRGRTPDAVQIVTRLADDPDVVEAALFGREIHVVVDPESGAGLDELLERNHLPAESGAMIEPSLEDVFVSYVRRAGGAVVG
jgi:ABC-2 type transport system ATP-binding protein